MNIFQLRKQARRAISRREAVQRLIEHNDKHDPKFPGSAKREAAVQLFNRYGTSLVAARRWLGMFNALPKSKPYRCSLPKKKQRELGILPPVEALKEAA
jgi:hypothetical protein